MTRRAILWDMDGTLIDSEPVHELALRTAIAKLGLEIPDGFNETLIGADGPKVFELLVTRTGLKLRLDEWLALKWNHFREHSTKILRRLPVSQAAERLAEQNIPMAVVSNSSSEEVALGLRATGLTEISNVIISRADVENGKPHPEGYLLAATRLSCRLESCLVVEDSLLGAKAGIAAGRSVLYHPQAPLNDAQPLPKGVRYLAPDADPMQTITHFLTSGTLTET